jgi:hypothetical protein
MPSADRLNVLAPDSAAYTNFAKTFFSGREDVKNIKKTNGFSFQIINFCQKCFFGVFVQRLGKFATSFVTIFASFLSSGGRGSG